MEHPIQNPTWADITAMITDYDVSQMKPIGLDLRDYSQVYAMAHKIYYYLAYKLMPLGNPWSDDEITTYFNWLVAGMPQDAAHAAEIAAKRKDQVERAGNRVRKDINSLSEGEIVSLMAAFEGLKSRDPQTMQEYLDNPDTKSYFHMAAKHWYPVPTFCQHHIYGYLPWHRYQMLDFEDALRSVPGCEDVTIPYWNIESGKIPDILKLAPFANYTFPIDVYPDYYTPPVNTGRPGTTTSRNAELQDSATINENIATARIAPTFGEYNGISNYFYSTTQSIIRAHDLGHNGTGPTMSNQDIAAYDPIFWFFHCNWDRLWWEWQVANNATTLANFEAIIGADPDHRWLTDPQMSISDPFGGNNFDAIDLSAMGISYDAPAGVKEKLTHALPIAMAPSWRDQHKGSSEKNVFSVKPENLDRISLRVKGINRIKISGSFWVELHIGGERVGRDAFFQSTFSGNCENCVAQAHVDFDFVFHRKHLVDSNGVPKEIKVEVINAVTGKTLNFEDIGNPTVNIRTPL